MTSTVTFDELLLRWKWEPIRNCPGRFKLVGVNPDLPPEVLLAPGARLLELHSKAAPDTVIVARVEGGGLISYRRPDGTHLHTLNNAEGFSRKLRQLGIVLESQHAT